MSKFFPKRIGFQNMKCFSTPNPHAQDFNDFQKVTMVHVLQQLKTHIYYNHVQCLFNFIMLIWSHMLLQNHLPRNDWTLYYQKNLTHNNPHSSVSHKTINVSKKETMFATKYRFSNLFIDWEKVRKTYLPKRCIAYYTLQALPLIPNFHILQ